MQANNGTHDEGQQEVDDHTMKANKMLTRCKNIENQDEFDEDDESDTMNEINQLFKPPQSMTNDTMSKQEFKEAWAKDKLNEVVAKHLQPGHGVVSRAQTSDIWSDTATAFMEAPSKGKKK